MAIDPGHGATPVARPPPRPSWRWTLVTWIVVLSGLLLATFLCVVVGGLAAVFGDRQRRVAHRMLRVGYSCIVACHPRYRLRITGLENLPPGPAILCPNHQSHSDVVYLFALPVGFKWIVKKELFRVPLFGISMRLARYPRIDRGDPNSALQVLEEVRTVLASGISVLSFPEGTRSPTGELGRFQSGAARMAVLGGVPLVPVGVAGTDTLMPKGSGMFSDQKWIGIHVGRAVDTTGATMKDVRRLTRELREAVVAARQEARRNILALEVAD